MKKQTEHHSDGTITDYWQDEYDNCMYGYDCDRYSFQDAVRQFYNDIRLYKVQLKECGLKGV